MVQSSAASGVTLARLDTDMSETKIHTRNDTGGTYICTARISVGKSDQGQAMDTLGGKRLGPALSITG